MSKIALMFSYLALTFCYLKVSLRRSFMSLLSTSVVCLSCLAASPPDTGYLLKMTASEAVQKLKSGEVSVETYIKALLNHTKQQDLTLKAFITIDEDKLLAAARQADKKRESGATLGPLFGVPISLKDIIVTKDLPTTFATKKFAGYQPVKNAPFVDRLIEAGALIFGKNNANELAYGSNGYNSHYGQSLNPYDINRISGGSSGGSAAAVSARMVPIAIGSDTAASIRVPAAFTGLYGLRPTTGRYDNSGVSPIAGTLDTIGPLTRSIADLILLDSIMSGDAAPFPTIALSQLRLGVPKNYFQDKLSKEVRAIFNAYLETLRASGVTLVEVELPNVAELTEAGLYAILFHETWSDMTLFLQEWGDGTTIEDLHASLGKDLKPIWDELVIPGAPNAFSEETYKEAINTIRPKLQAQYDAYFIRHNVDALLFPTTASIAPLAEPANAQEIMIDGEKVSLFINDQSSGPGALAGQPGITIPVALSSSGLPMGISLDGKRGQDKKLLAIAKALKPIVATLPAPRALGWIRPDNITPEVK